MPVARQRGEMAAARVFSATQIACARVGATSEVVGSTLDYGLIPRKFEGLSAKCTETDVDTRMCLQGSELSRCSKVE